MRTFLMAKRSVGHEVDVEVKNGQKLEISIQIRVGLTPGNRAVSQLICVMALSLSQRLFVILS